MHEEDFHGGVFPLGFRVTADRIYRILTGSKNLEKTQLVSHFNLKFVLGDQIISG